MNTYLFRLKGNYNKILKKNNKNEKRQRNKLIKLFINKNIFIKQTTSY